MSARAILRGLAALAVAMVAAGPGTRGAQAGPKPVDPAQVVPLDRIAPEHREGVAEVIREPSFHRQGAPETFPCNPKVYLALLNEPALTLALWQDLGSTPARLRQVAPGRYEGTDGAGTTATWEFVYRSNRLNVLLCDLEHLTPRGNSRLNGRIVLVVRSGFYRETNGEFWVQHDVEAFVKIDSRGWKAVAKTFRPLIEKLLEDQVQEAGWFVSLMGRLVAMYPNWAADVCAKQDQIPADVRANFRALVMQARRPDASPGRPQMADNTTTQRR